MYRILFTLLLLSSTSVAGTITYTGGEGTAGLMTNTSTFDSLMGYQPGILPYTEDNLAFDFDGDNDNFSSPGIVGPAFSDGLLYESAGSNNRLRIRMADGTNFTAFQGGFSHGSTTSDHDIYIGAYADGGTLIDSIFLEDQTKGNYFAFSSDMQVDYLDLWAGPGLTDSNPPGYNLIALDNFSVHAAGAAVPEPGTFAILVSAAVGMSVMAYRRRKKPQE